MVYCEKNLLVESYYAQFVYKIFCIRRIVYARSYPSDLNFDKKIPKSPIRQHTFTKDFLAVEDTNFYQVVRPVYFILNYSLHVCH